MSNKISYFIVQSQKISEIVLFLLDIANKFSLPTASNNKSQSTPFIKQIETNISLVPIKQPNQVTILITHIWLQKFYTLINRLTIVLSNLVDISFAENQCSNWLDSALTTTSKDSWLLLIIML